jgi:hypothetical protein
MTRVGQAQLMATKNSVKLELHVYEIKVLGHQMKIILIKTFSTCTNGFDFSGCQVKEKINWKVSAWFFENTCIVALKIFPKALWKA